MYLYFCMSEGDLHVCIAMYVLIQMYTYTCLYMQLRTCVYIDICRYMYMYIYLCRSVYTCFLRIPQSAFFFSVNSLVYVDKKRRSGELKREKRADRRGKRWNPGSMKIRLFYAFGQTASDRGRRRESSSFRCCPTYGSKRGLSKSILPTAPSVATDMEGHVSGERERQQSASRRKKTLLSFPITRSYSDSVDRLLTSS